MTSWFLVDNTFNKNIQTAIGAIYLN